MSSELLYCGAMAFNQPISGISVFSYENGTAGEVKIYGDNVKSQSILTKAGDYMISVSEIRGSGSICSYRIPEDGSLEQVFVMPTDIGPLSYVSSTPDGAYVFVTCMGTGCLMMLRVNEDGTLTLTDDRRMTGHGISARQINGKTHSSQVSPDGRLIACANLGADEVDLFRIDRENEKLVYLMAAPVDWGQLPRHMAFNADGTMLYLVTEVGCRIYAFAVKEDKLEEVATYLVKDDTKADRIMTSDIRISPDGKFIAAAIRGQNKVVVYKILESGLLDIVGHFPCGGEETRGLAFGKKGDELFCANNSGTITRLSFDRLTGELGAPEVIAEVPAAGSVMVI